MAAYVQTPINPWRCTAIHFAGVLLVVGVCLIPSAVGVAKLDHDRRLSEIDRALVGETDEHGGALDDYFARAQSIVLLTANSPPFGHVLACAASSSARPAPSR